MKLSKRCLFTIAALLGLALLPVPAQAQALADIEVTKAITGIDADGDPTNGTNSDGFEIDTNSTNPSIDEWLDGMVPPFTVINFRVELTVNSPAGLDLKEVVVKDNCGSELSVVCVPMTFGVLNLDCHILPASGGRRLIWQVGPLGTGTATLTVIATTNQNPGGHQRYTSCGLHEFNSGPTATGFVVKVRGKSGNTTLRRQTADGDGILLTVSGGALPQCSNCIDDRRRPACRCG